MAIELKIPPVGESITEVQIAQWLKKPGDVVKKEEAVAVIDSEKTTFDLLAPEAGTLGQILHPVGATINVGTVVSSIETGGAPAAAPVEKTAPVPPLKAPQAPAEKPTAASATKAEKPATVSAPAKPASKPESEKPPMPPPTPATRETPPAPASEPESEPGRKPKSSGSREERIVPMTMLRRTAARRLVEAKQQMAMLTTFNEVDVSAIQGLRKEHQEAFEKRYGTKLGFMSFFVKAAIDGLKQFPKLNAEIRDKDIIYHDYYDIGVAIASERGLVVPILRDAEKMEFAEVEKAIGDFAKRSRDGKLKPEELAGGTFTITNGGVFGSLFSTPIINPPQCAILGMHTIQERPMAVQGQVVIRPMMYLALSYDHRLVDGREAVLFLARIKAAIENPARMLIGI
jgi:2-oxoglutarate dehydrogenase E2 component (dihydrolipoamide succinyltransferase)